jgi:hypothetical protein|tara:strand:+ start:424 stop:630 length:207 start_codon:yes stop_codon:yes gene_type:complete
MAKPVTEYKLVKIQISGSEHDRLHQVAKELKVSYQNLVGSILRQYLADVGRPLIIRSLQAEQVEPESR